MYTTKVNVNDLVIDMPLDEGNVAQKMESLKSGGLVQPVAVWLKDFRIIDGFHRTEAAKRLGWTEVDCVVKDCDEETFWDARIQSARQHHKVTNERMKTWILECWQQTEWYVESEGNDNLLRQISQVLWNIAKKNIQHSSYLGLAAIDHPVIAWIASKANAWQYSENELCEMLLNTSISGYIGTIYHANALAARYDMDNETRLDFVDNVRYRQISDSRYAGRIAEEDLNTYAQHLTSTPKGKRKDLTDIVQENTYASIQSQIDERAEADRKHQAWVQSEEGKRAARQKIKNDFSVSVSALRAYVADNRADFAQLDDGYEMLMSLSAWAANKVAELFPEREQPTELQLRRELADAYKQIESLQKALDSRKGYTPKLPQVMAYSSTDIAKVTR